MYTYTYRYQPLRSSTCSLLALVSIAAGGCSSIDRLSQIGEKPKLTAMDDPTAQPGYKPVQMPMPKPEAVSYNANSLWRNGSRSFFKDQRAHQIGDLLTVTVNITDQANFANETQRSRANYGRFRGHRFHRQQIVERQRRQAAARPHPDRGFKSLGQRRQGLGAAPGKPCRPTSPPSSRNCCRTAIIVVEGKQEIRVNMEIRELIVAGIVRPEDIQSDNTIDSSKIAQARISYGGRGQITDVQQQRYGQQVMDVLLPF